MRTKIASLTTLILMIFASVFMNAVYANASESELEAPGPLGALKGSLLTPEVTDGPVILIIPGSGPTDRDGNNPLGVDAAPYKLLAEGLAEKGITTLRIDKRGLFSSKAAVANPNAVTVKDYTGDVRNWVDVLRKKTGVKCVWLLGHSEGGLVALASLEANDGVCGLILVAAPGQKFGDLLREQLKANPVNTPILEPAFAAIASLEAGKTVDVSHMHPALIGLFHPSVQGYLISLMSVDPAQLITQWHKPILILQGERDIQVSVADAKLLKAAAPDASLVLLPNTNHVLKTVTSSDRGQNAATYTDPHLPLAPGIVDAIVKFVSGK